MSDSPDFSNSVILPSSDFAELQEAAFNQPPASLKQGAITAATTTLVVSGIAGAVAAGTYGWAKAVDWLEMRRCARKSAMADLEEERRSKK